jgi:pantetheine-phosphate adenylyltransferase
MEKEEKIGFYPGSFDPFHIGHEYIVNMALDIFDKVIICVAVNDNKTPHINSDKRVAIIKEIFKNNPRVEVKITKGLIADAAKDENATAIVKGVRNINDFTNEMLQADCNMFIGKIPTIFIPTTEAYSFISSTLIRTILNNSKDSKDSKDAKKYKLLSGIVNKKFIDAFYE